MLKVLGILHYFLIKGVQYIELNIAYDLDKGSEHYVTFIQSLDNSDITYSFEPKRIIVKFN